MNIWYFRIFILWLVAFTQSTYSLEVDKDSLKYISFNKTKQFKEKLNILRTINNPSKFKNEEEWISYLDNEILKNEGYKIRIFNLNLLKIEIYNSFDKVEKAHKLAYSYYKKNRDNINDRLLCSMISSLNIYKENQIKSKEYSFLLKEKIKVCPQELISFSNFYSFVGLTQLAIEHYKKFEIVNLNKISYKTGKDLNNIGVFHMRGKAYDSAFIYYNKSLNVFKEVKENKDYEDERALNYWIGLVKGNIGQCYLNFGKYNKAISLFKEESKQARIFYSDKDWNFLEDYYRDMGLSYLRLGDLKMSKKYIDSLQFKNFKLPLTQLKAEYYELEKRYDSATYYYRELNRIADSSSFINNKRLSPNFESIIKLKEKTVRQENRIKNFQDDILKNKVLNNFYLYITIFLGLGLIISFYLYRKLKSKNDIIEIQKDEIQKNLVEKTTLLRELHHRVKNNLQIILSIFNLQLQKIKDPETKSTFQYSINRVSAISRVNEKLYKSKLLSKISINSYLNSLISELKKVYTSLKDVNFEITVRKSLYLNIDQTQAIGLIVNELLTNSYKYAFSNNEDKKIKLKIFEKNKFIYFSYSDNGTGFDKKNIDINESIGLKLIESLIIQLDSTPNFSSFNGAKIKFNFKKGQ